MAEAIRLYGYEGEVWSFGEPKLSFPADRVLDPGLLKADDDYRWDVIDQAVRRFDIFHFQYGRSLAEPIGVTVPDLWDIPLLKSLGKKVFMHFRGSDVRLKSKHVQREPDSYFNASDIPCDEPRILGKVSICRRFCDAMFVSTPGLLDYVPDAHWVPHVVDGAFWKGGVREEPKVPVVAHIPSSRGTKSSNEVDAILTDLAREGICQYRPLENLSGRDAMRSALHSADMVVDSLGIGDHGLISIEAMASGAIALAHIHERNRARNPGVPVVEVTAATLAEVVRELASDPDLRSELRVQGEMWAERRHGQVAVARLLAGFYESPASTPTLSYPDWPRSENRKRMEKLELELEKRRAKTMEGVTIGVSSNPARLEGLVLDRLVNRISELEQALASTDPASPMLASSPTIVLKRARPDARPEFATRLKSFIRRHPTIHRLVRAARSAVRGTSR
jgi:hypothetical protein